MVAPVISPSKLKPNDPCWCGSGNKFKRCHQAATERVRPGTVSPEREVPAGIELPHYAPDGGTDDRSEPMVKDADTLDRMRRTGRAAAEILRKVGDAIAPGVTTDELDALCHELCIKAGGYPSPLNYGIDPKFPKSICTSVNEVICHGVPDSRPLRDGDIINLDVTLFREGVHGDTNATWGVGTIDPESQHLIRVTRECTARGIEAVKIGRPVSDIGRAIQDHAEAEGLSVVRAFVGHGVGKEFHTPPEILHYFNPRANEIMVPGMTFTIEPMIAIGAWQQRTWDDGWTAATVDGRRTAQFEHTMVVTEAGAELLTLHPDGEWSGDGNPQA
jgi:methionyl aminopeptidase